jgi:hypothetical protein
MKRKRAKVKKTYRTLTELPKVYVPLDEAKRTRARDAAWIEMRLGPGVPRITRPGRPRKGTVVKAGRVHSIRVPDSDWAALQARAKAVGLSTNTAIRLAVLSWTNSGRARPGRSSESR